jgi:hypothetical protein
MKFFTPDLYERFNSPDSDVADLADAEWEDALQEYRLHLERIDKKLPPNAKRLAKEACLHDAELLALEMTSPLTKKDGPSLLGLMVPSSLDTKKPMAFIVVKQDGQLILLVYLLSREAIFSRPVESNVFSKSKPRWLYDEIDWNGESCTHEILLSTGAVLKLHFLDCNVLPMPALSTLEEVGAASS